MADNVIFSNNASALLAATITAGDTTIQVASGFGALFPSPGGTEFFYATLEDDAGNIEIVKCTARTGDNLTVVRAQDGTTAQAFTLTVTRVELRATKIVLEEFLQKNGGSMTGAVDMNGNNITDAVLTGASTQITAGEIVGVPLRGAAGVSSNELVVPGGGGRATVGGAQILAAGDDIVAQLDTAGVITLDSATTGVVLDQSGAYLRMQGALRVAAPGVATDYLEMSHDDTDFTFNFQNTTEVNWNAILNMTADLQLNENDLIGALHSDYAVKSQNKTAASSTSIDYTAGSYVVVTHGTNITTLSVTNLPASGVAFLRLRLVHTAGGETCDFSTLGTTVRAVGGAAPSMSAGAGDIDIVDIWTEDGGTNWYVMGSPDWSAI